MSQLVRNNAISTFTGYDRLHEGEGIAVLAAQAPQACSATPNDARTTCSNSTGTPPPDDQP